MRIDIITCLPALLESPLQHSILKRAQQKQLLQLHIHNLRDYTTDKHRKVDAPAYGGNAGMVLRIEPIANCLRTLQAATLYDEIIYMAPDGEMLTQATANQLSLCKNLIILCGHYKGIDERVRAHFITKEISIGDYVLTGGELPAAVLTDTIVRLIPGVLNDSTAALSDSFQNDTIAPPIYTRPANFEGMMVPEVLRQGNHAAIQAWQRQQSSLRTQKRRPCLIEDH